MQLRILLSLFVASVMLITACENNDNDENDPTSNLVNYGSKTDNGLSVEMFADEGLKVGYNKIYLQLTDDNTDEIITEAHITHNAIMYMDTMKHSCPTTNPDLLANDDQLFEGEIVFIMASGMMGTWDDTVSIHNESANTMHQIVFDNLPVQETNMKKNLVTYEADSTKVIHIVTLTLLGDPQVGSNDFILTVHRKASMMSFPEETGLDILVDPQMPDMGHGSDGNINPEYTENGKYTGTVVFSMTGYWTVDFTFSQDGEDLGAIQYEFNF